MHFTEEPIDNSTNPPEFSSDQSPSPNPIPKIVELEEIKAKLSEAFKKEYTEVKQFEKELLVKYENMFRIHNLLETQYIVSNIEHYIVRYCWELIVSVNAPFN